MKLVIKIIFFFTLIISIIWFVNDKSFSSLFAVLSTLGVLIALFFNQNKIESELKKKKDILEEVYDRIHKEYPNFEKLTKSENSYFNSESHRLASTVYPYELMIEAAEKLIKIRIFSSKAKKLITSLRNKEDKKILSLLNKLERKLRKYICKIG